MKHIIEIISEQDNNNKYNATTIFNMIKDRLNKLKTLDQREQQLDTICLDIAYETKGNFKHVYYNDNSILRFNYIWVDGITLFLE